MKASSDSVRTDPHDVERVLRGLPAAPGLACGPIVLWYPQLPDIPRSNSADPGAERARLGAARGQARGELQQLYELTNKSAGKDQAQVFAAQLLMLGDPALISEAEAAIQEGKNAEAAWMDAVQHFASNLRALPNPTLAARAGDVLDVGTGVLRLLLAMPFTARLALDAPAVIAARDLTPSQTARLDRDLVLGFCCADGGPTSHTAVLARALGLPAVMGLGPTILAVPPGTPVLVDGFSGEVTFQPTPATTMAFDQRRAHLCKRAASEKALSAQPAVTRDGVHIRVEANIGGIEDARRAVDSGADGVGLLRTEFLYMDRAQPPTEDEQMVVYRQIMEILGDRHIVARTFDIGGDKPSSYIEHPAELNPFLGWRGVRMARERPDLLATQFRALLRAAADRHLDVMVPMVSLEEEVIQARALIQACASEVGGKAHVGFGIMVEVPSAALLAERIAPHVDFFSIGTNDLTQYTLAADRTNPRVASLASPFDPAVLELINRTIVAAHRNGKWAGLCGEFAADPLATGALIGMRLDEFSMAPASIPEVKQRIRGLNAADCRTLADRVLELSSGQRVREFLKTHSPVQGRV